MEQTTGYYSTFVVKIWCDDTERIMRGHIQHVSTREYEYFLSLGNMTSFIMRHLGPPAHDSVIQDAGGSSLVADGFGDIGQDE